MQLCPYLGRNLALDLNSKLDTIIKHRRPVRNLCIKNIRELYVVWVLKKTTKYKIDIFVHHFQRNIFYFILAIVTYSQTIQ